MSFDTEGSKTSDSEHTHALQGGLRKREHQEVHQSEYVERANTHFQGKISNIFLQFDADGSGTIDREELKVVLASMGYELNDKQLGELLEQVDVDGNGSLDLEEFTTLVNLWRDAAGYKIFDDGQSTAAQHIRTSTSTRTKMMVPDVPWRWAWDTIYLFVGSYFIMTVLMVHTFEEKDQESLDEVQLYLILPDLLGTFFYLIEMFMKLSTVVKEDGGILITDRREIMKSYFLSIYFPIDLLSALPLRLFATGAVAQNILNHFRLLVVFRFPTLFPTSGLVTITSQYVSYQYGLLPYIQGTLAFFCSMLLMTVIHQLEVRKSIDLGLVAPEEGTFAACTYWTVYVVSGVGYGDMTPQTDTHRWYAGFLFVVSMIVNGLFVGSMVSLMQEADVENSRRSSLVLMQAVLRFFHVPESLQEEILQFQNHILQRDIATSYASIVDMLPGQMRHNILMQTNVPLLQGVHTFRFAHTSTIVQIAEQLTSIFASPEVYIAVAGDRSRDLVILNYGFIDVLTVGRYVTTLKRGGYFGEMGVLDKDGEVIYRYSFKALTYCDLFLLPIGRLVALEERFPKFAKDLVHELEEVKGKPDRFDLMLLQNDGKEALELHHSGAFTAVTSSLATSEHLHRAPSEQALIVPQAEGLLAQRAQSGLDEGLKSPINRSLSSHGASSSFRGRSIRGKEMFGVMSPLDMGVTSIADSSLSESIEDLNSHIVVSVRRPSDDEDLELELDEVVRDLEVAIANEMESIQELETQLISLVLGRGSSTGNTEEDQIMMNGEQQQQQQQNSHRSSSSSLGGVSLGEVNNKDKRLGRVRGKSLDRGSWSPSITTTDEVTPLSPEPRSPTSTKSD